MSERWIDLDEAVIRWPQSQPPEFWRIDHAALRDVVREPGARAAFNEKLRAAMDRHVKDVEQRAAWAILTEALDRIDELEAELAGRRDAPSLGGSRADT